MAQTICRFGVAACYETNKNDNLRPQKNYCPESNGSRLVTKNKANAGKLKTPNRLETANANRFRAPTIMDFCKETDLEYAVQNNCAWGFRLPSVVRTVCGEQGQVLGDTVTFTGGFTYSTLSSKNGIDSRDFHCPVRRHTGSLGSPEHHISNCLSADSRPQSLTPTALACANPSLQ